MEDKRSRNLDILAKLRCGIAKHVATFLNGSLVKGPRHQPAYRKIPASYLKANS